MIVPASELAPYGPDSREIVEAREFYYVLGTLAARAVGVTDSGLLVSAGRLHQFSLAVVSSDTGTSSRYAVVLENSTFPTHAVMSNIICAPDYPIPGLVNVADVEDITFVADLVDETHFHSKFSQMKAKHNGPKFDELMQRLFGPNSKLSSFDTAP